MPTVVSYVVVEGERGGRGCLVELDAIRKRTCAPTAHLLRPIHSTMMRRRPSQQAPPPHAYPTYPEERKAGPSPTAYVPQSSIGGASSTAGARSYLPHHPSSTGQQFYSGGESSGGGRKTFQQTASLHGRWAFKGLEDACRVKKAYELVAK